MNILKQLVILSFIVITINAQTILENGISVPIGKVKQVYSVLRKLCEQAENQYLLFRLYEASNSDLELMNSVTNDLDRRRSYIADLDSFKHIEDEGKKAILLAESLGLCDNAGKIEKETGEIIKCSLVHRFLYRNSGTQVPFFWGTLGTRKRNGEQIIIKSPIALKTYFTKAYWFSKK